MTKGDRIWRNLCSHWTMGVAVIAGLVTTHFMIFATYMTTNGRRAEARMTAPLRTEAKACDGSSLPPPGLPSPATEAQMSAALNDVAVASLVNALQGAATDGPGAYVDALLVRIRNSGDAGRRIVQIALRTEQRPEVRAVLMRALE